jgi:shikimate dehydrogenase
MPNDISTAPITGKTKVYGVFGDPVAHSLSPVMHNATFRHFHIDAVYVAFHVLPEDLPRAVAGLRSLGIAGINVTIPHKETILPLLDHLDPVAAQIGAVNTVVNRDGILTGYNTDASGFLRSARQELHFEPRTHKALLLGAGGAGRAAAQALIAAGVASLTVANRHPGRAEQLLAAFPPAFAGQQLTATDYQDTAFRTAVAEADLIVNTTSLGLHGETLNFLPLENIKGSALIYDMVYSMTGTPLTRSAHALGLPAVDGFTLLAAQGEDAFRLWTDRSPPAGFMCRQLLEYQRKTNMDGKG